MAIREGKVKNCIRKQNRENSYIGKEKKKKRKILYKEIKKGKKLMKLTNFFPST